MPVNDAYEYVIPSYGWMIERYESANSRLQNMIGFAAAVTFAVPVFVAGLIDKPDLTHPLFLAGMSLGGVAAFIGLLGRSFWHVRLIDPSELLIKEFKSMDTPEFRRQMIHYAGLHFEQNQKVILRKSRVSDAVLALVVIEVGLTVIWALRQI